MLFLDVETTGLPPKGTPSAKTWPHVVSASWAVFRGPETRLLHRTFVIKPNRHVIPLESSKIHGITQERALREGVPLARVLHELHKDIVGRAPTRLITYNLEFDSGMMHVSFERGGVANPLNSLKGICAMRTAASQLGSRWLSLQELHATLFGKKYSNAHSAAADVLACARCYFELRKRKFEDVPPDPFAQDLVGRILDWAGDHPEFDTTYVDNLSRQLGERGSLSDKQIAALENIIRKWRI